MKRLTLQTPLRCPSSTFAPLDTSSEPGRAWIQGRSWAGLVVVEPVMSISVHSMDDTYPCQTADSAAEPSSADAVSVWVLALPLLNRLGLGLRLLFGVFDRDVLTCIGFQDRTNVLRGKNSNSCRQSPSTSPTHTQGKGSNPPSPCHRLCQPKA